MIFSNRHPPKLEGGVRDAGLVAAWARSLFADISQILRNGMLPEDQFDAIEEEVTFAAVPGSQAVAHPLLRVPTRVEVVRADQSGVVFTTAQSATSVTVATSAIGTYRLRIS